MFKNQPYLTFLLFILLFTAGSLGNATVFADYRPIDAPPSARALALAPDSNTATPVPTLAPTTTRTPTARRTNTPTRTATMSPTRPPSPTPVTPAQVEIRHSGKQAQLLVNGKPVYLTGMNYNVNYTALNEAARWQLHRRDFKIMRDAGVNVIVGWGIYDEITLRVAQEFGIGVIMPFDLPSDGAYENENYHAEIKTAFSEYVKRFRNFPAVWGWNPGGDELLYRMDTEQHRTPDKLQAAADLEIELAQIAQALDPHRIVLIKEPRDWYIPFLGDALARAQTPFRNSLIYGVNVYGRIDDIQLALDNAKMTLRDQLGLAMLVSEFGPFNSPPVERATNYAAIWKLITTISDVGGCVYVFGPDQPNLSVANPYDLATLLPNQYSLVDMNGAAIDGSLAALAAQWKQVAAPPH